MPRLTFAPIAMWLAADVWLDPAGGFGVPCLWRVLFDVVCPGCGLTRASLLLAHGRFREAAEMNAFIFLFALTGVWRAFPIVARMWRYVRWRNLAQPN